MCTFRTDHLSFFAPWFDTEPDAFSFTSLTNKELSTAYESNTISISGIDTTSAISISAWWEYKIGAWWSYTSAVGTVTNGDTITVKQTSSASYSSLKTITLTVGWVDGSFSVTTKSAPSGGGGGWGGGAWWATTTVKDFCISGDYSWNYFDGKCEGTSQTWATSSGNIEENTRIENNNILSGSSNFWTWVNQPFTNDLNTCFAWEKLPFPDISTSWAKCYIMYLYKVWVIDGKEGNYLPQANTTRAEFIKMVLWSSKTDYSQADTSTLSFSDVNNNSWQARVIKVAIDNWLIDATNGYFRPDEAISRIEAIKILLLLMDYKFKDNYESSFSDVKEGWMIKYVEASKDMWLIEGQTINWKLIFKPLDSITRAESSKIMVKLILIIMDLVK
jgi:hypothetical protein